MKNSNKKAMMLVSLSLLTIPVCGCHHTETLKPDGEKIAIDEAVPFAAKSLQKQFSNIESNVNPDKKGKKSDKTFGYSFHNRINEFSIKDESKIHYDKKGDEEGYTTTQTLDFGLKDFGSSYSFGGIEGNINYEKFDVGSRANNIKGAYEFKIGNVHGSYKKTNPKGETAAAKEFERSFNYDNAKINAYLDNSKVYFDPTNNELRLLIKDTLDIFQSYCLAGNSLGSTLTEKIVGKYDANNKKFTGGFLGSKYYTNVDQFTEGVIAVADNIAESRLKTLEFEAYNRLCKIEHSSNYIGFKALDDLYEEAFDALTAKDMTVENIGVVEEKYQKLITEKVALLDKASDVEKDNTDKESYQKPSISDEIAKQINEHAKWLEAYKLKDGSYSFYAAFDSEKAKNTLGEYRVEFEKQLTEQVEEKRITEQQKTDIINTYDEFKKHINIHKCEFVFNVGKRGFNYFKTLVDIDTQTKTPFHEVAISAMKPHVELRPVGTIEDKFSFKFNYEIGIDEIFSAPKTPSNWDDYAELNIKNLIKNK